jgi:hypothetical protein
MRPTVCAICDVRFESGGGSVRFVSRPSDREWRRRAEAPGFVGHPPDTEWFCETHIAAARDRAPEVTIDVALRQLRDLYRTEPVSGGEAAAAAGPDIGAVERTLRDNFAEIAMAVGLGETTAAVTNERRDLPADGAVPPDCPFVLTTTRSVASESQSLELRFERAHWSESDIARASVELVARGRKEFALRADIPTDGSSQRVTGITATGRDAGLVSRLVSDVSALSTHRR